MSSQIPVFRQFLISFPCYTPHIRKCPTLEIIISLKFSLNYHNIFYNITANCIVEDLFCWNQKWTKLLMSSGCRREGVFGQRSVHSNTVPKSLKNVRLWLSPGQRWLECYSTKCSICLSGIRDTTWKESRVCYLASLQFLQEATLRNF